ncbi:MAG TPA: molybdenum cofactor biosynthesis protein MoaE [Gemmatimonadales bacterium]|nr:molybdenum cofactor biosynthesis protein MoaE [Gemmatimonadales bacterium]
MAYLSERPLDLGSLVARVSAPERGAVACFLGTVRNHHQGRAVISLDYSAYVPMAEAECTRIVGEAEARWPARVALEHRLGSLRVGDAAVAVAAAASHRDAAFAACRFVIEETKRRVPIWKREHFADGTVEWVDPTGTHPAERSVDVAADEWGV